MAAASTDSTGVPPLLRPNAGDALPNLYEVDETAWLEEMSRLVYEGRFGELDYQNLASYLDDMAARDRREVKSRLKVLLAHLLKWEAQPGYQCGSWKATILVQQQELQALLESKTLRNHAEKVLQEAYRLAVAIAISETGLLHDTFPSSCAYTVEHLLTAELC